MVQTATLAAERVEIDADCLDCLAVAFFENAFPPCRWLGLERPYSHHPGDPNHRDDQVSVELDFEPGIRLECTPGAVRQVTLKRDRLILTLHHEVASLVEGVQMIEICFEITERKHQELQAALELLFAADRNTTVTTA